MMLVDITKVDLTAETVTVYWSQYPLYRQRITVYDIQEVIEWISSTHEDGLGVTPEFLFEEFELMLVNMICDFHESQTTAPFQQEIEWLEKKLQAAKNELKRMGKIIDALQRRILKQNRVPKIKKHHE